MSLILDALNKSEQERSERDNAANIHAVHGSPPVDAKRLHRRRWFWELIGVVLILVLVYWYTEFTAKDSVITPSMAPPALDPTPAPAPAPTPAPVRPGVTMARPVDKPVVEVPVNEALKSPATDTRSSDAVRQLYNQPAVVEAPPVAVVAEQAPVSDAVAPAPAPADDDNAQWIAIPLISELSPTISSGIASIDFSEHLYSDEEGASFVNLNGEQRKEGDLVAPGLRLVKIFEYGVILDYQGTQFRLLPLSGWVNM